MRPTSEVLILGAGLSGLAAARILGDRALVLEREPRPGGLVRTERHGEYWFDHVLHLLYCPDKVTEARVCALVGEALQPCPPEAWVEIPEGIVRYPFQMHLGGLPTAMVVRCLKDLAGATFGPRPAQLSNFEEMLRLTFGLGMCEAFLFPYNRKMWKRPLDTIAPTSQWTITHPDFEEVLKGALNQDLNYIAYNSGGWYPRPAPDAPVRGMEVLSAALAEGLTNVRLNHAVESIDLVTRTVSARVGGQLEEFGYENLLLLTLPLPKALAMCRQTPDDLRAAISRLVRNRVVSVAFSIEGPRPVNRGHWRYYADESIIFNRLIYMTNFDPLMAPPNGWGVMAEITLRAEDPLPSEAELIERCRMDLERVGGLPEGCRVIDTHFMELDPAYVVFSVGNQEIVDEAIAFFRAHGVELIGRYARWEYTSMGQVMRDGFAWAEEYAARTAPAPQDLAVG